MKNNEGRSVSQHDEPQHGADCHRQRRSYQEELEQYRRIQVEASGPDQHQEPHQNRHEEENVRRPDSGGQARQGPSQGGQGKKKKKKKKKKGGGAQHGSCHQKPPGFVKKPFMSQEFISQHAVEHRGRLICKYFLGGRCLKEDQCKFEHELVILDKKQELCKYYVQGFCTKGGSCIYMHNDYPCKFFHTRTKCYQGEHCKFSHDPLTETTRPLLEKVLNKSEVRSVNAEQERCEDRPSSVKAPATLPGAGPTPDLGFRFYSSCLPDHRLQVPWASGAAVDGQHVSAPCGSISRAQAAPPLQRDVPLHFGDSSPHSGVPPQQEELSKGQELRDTPAEIPLRPLLGSTPRDPRPLGTASTPVALSFPAFARQLGWPHEDCTATYLPAVVTALYDPPKDAPPEEVEHLTAAPVSLTPPLPTKFPVSLTLPPTTTPPMSLTPPPTATPPVTLTLPSSATPPVTLTLPSSATPPVSLTLPPTAMPPVTLTLPSSATPPVTLTLPSSATPPVTLTLPSSATPPVTLTLPSSATPPVSLTLPPTATPPVSQFPPPPTTPPGSLSQPPPAAPPEGGDQAPAVHNLPVQVLMPWSRVAPSSRPPEPAQVGCSGLFQDIFKRPLPLLSASDWPL
ncbi:proline-rich protein 36-like isoform X2 [Brienomyrus brachyistius]|nr:proline-rich protein 36-like isoform X2 [Brienomyrus brachyistius]XP_048843286.1 proline-rich protein 36-like isoform X2 [Brienomyrus brachyistius]XP_048843287.1 proline-rich protein 36-like isoform X2 [Brienomyrus brachyistius]